VRIAFAGSGGTGKTTTLKEVNKTLKLPVIKEGVREYLEEHNIKHLRELSGEDTFKMQLAFLDQKEVSESQKEFIADRTTIDSFIYALYWLGRNDKFETSLMHYMKRCMQHAAKSYDVIFVFPFGIFPVEDDGIRSKKPMYQLQIQMMIERMLTQLEVPVHYIQEPSVQGRVQEILKTVEVLEATNKMHEICKTKKIQWTPQLQHVVNHHLCVDPKADLEFLLEHLVSEGYATDKTFVIKEETAGIVH
jgi:nicotinamide riboside kinase